MNNNEYKTCRLNPPENTHGLKILRGNGPRAKFIVVLAKPRVKWGTLICVHYTGAQPAPCPPSSHFVYPWELGTQPGWCGRPGSCGTTVVLYLTANHPEFMSFHNMANVQKGADLARTDACLSTKAADWKQSVDLSSELTEVRFWTSHETQAQQWIYHYLEVS